MVLDLFGHSEASIHHQCGIGHCIAPLLVIERPRYEALLPINDVHTYTDLKLLVRLQNVSFDHLHRDRLLLLIHGLDPLFGDAAYSICAWKLISIQVKSKPNQSFKLNEVILRTEIVIPSEGGAHSAPH